ncbi:MAG: hypothetical protein JO219_08460 [Candidatus Eremiobacteraeota bacterium]|nr:hypothetical protein [Candidatus Eremiobacteraeota bacterium]
MPQPLYRVVTPEDEADDVSYKAPHIVVATDAADFSSVERVSLLPESGKPIDLGPSSLSTKTQDLRGIQFTSLYGHPAVLAAIHTPGLSPSTTYDVVLIARTSQAPGCPPQLTEHVGRFTTEAQTALDAYGDFANTPDAAPTGEAATMNGQLIFDKAREVLRTVRYPSFIAYTVHVRSNTAGKPFLESFHSIVRTQDDIVLTHKTPIETTSKPDNPYGTRFDILGFKITPHTKGYQQEPFGVPQISPIYSFGLRPIGEVLALPPTPEPEPSDIRSLGRVEAVAQDYDVALVGIERYHVRWAYHLRLTPRQQPNVYRLREMFVDTQTFVPWEIVSAGIFPGGAASKVPWTVHYTMASGYWLMTSESTQATLRVGGALQSTPARGYDGLMYALSDFEYPKDMQDFSFFDVGSSDAAEY